jgi:hypothetical protein
MPKKVRNLHYELCSPDMIVRAQYEAQKKKTRRKEILLFNERIVENLDAVMVFLASSKEKLWTVYWSVKGYVENALKLRLKKQANPFPVDSEVIDFVGYRSNHFNVLLRKRILYNFYKKLENVRKKYGIIEDDTIKHELSSYWGFLSHCTEKHRLNILKMAKNGKIN